MFTLESLRVAGEGILTDHRVNHNWYQSHTHYPLPVTLARSTSTTRNPGTIHIHYPLPVTLARSTSTTHYP